MSEISNNICKVAEFKQMDLYKAHCDCISDDHIQTLCIEYDEECDIVTLSIYSKIKYNIKYDWDTNLIKRIQYWFRRQITKIKAIKSILVDGEVEAENEFIFRGPKQIQDYCNAIQSSTTKFTNKFNNI